MLAPAVWLFLQLPRTDRHPQCLHLPPPPPPGSPNPARPPALLRRPTSTPTAACFTTGHATWCVVRVEGCGRGWLGLQLVHASAHQPLPVDFPGSLPPLTSLLLYYPPTRLFNQLPTAPTNTRRSHRGPNRCSPPHPSPFRSHVPPGLLLCGASAMCRSSPGGRSARSCRNRWACGWRGFKIAVPGAGQLHAWGLLSRTQRASERATVCCPSLGSSNSGGNTTA